MENITTKLAIELKKGARSFYHPFLCTLPDDVTFIPAMWSESKIKEMDITGTQAEKDLRDMQSKWREDATTFLSKSSEIGECNDAKKVSVSDWIWARATLQARGFSFHSRGGENSDLSDDKEGGNIVSFIPFITLSNHDDLLGGVTTMGKDPHPSTSYTFRTSSIVKTNAGSQLFNYYGAISFQQKMLSFGWIDRCPEESPEGFCITALLTGSNTSKDETGSNTINPPQTIEIKSDILLATAIANMKRKEKSNEVNSSLLSNNLSLKVTSLKFEIRGVISKIVDQGMSREEAIADINRALLERKAMLEGNYLTEYDEAGDEEEQTSAAVAATATVADTAIKPSTSASSIPIRGPTVKASAPAMSRQKSKIRKGKGKGKGQSGLALAVDGTKVESDGQYIRRTEAEAVELLLSYVSAC